jgi:Holliday junction DNA helicase RuvA
LSLTLETKAGVGYKFFISQETFHTFKSQNQAFVYVYTQFVNDLFFLYGFFCEEERNFFKTLIQVSGIGPRMTMRALSQISYKEFYAAIIHKDIKRIAAIPGIGAKKAEKIVVEIKDRLLSLKVEDSLLIEENETLSVFSDAMLALENFGFDSAKVKKVLQDLRNSSKEIKLEILIKEALSILNSK